MKHPGKFRESLYIAAFVRRMAWSGLAACCALPVFAAQVKKPSPAVAQKNIVTPTQQVPVSLADQPPTAATVTFHGGQLTVHAHNSTLLQILQAITAQTGMEVQGSPGNHRIFGVYGPDKPDVVISDLLTGFGFNYLVVGTGRDGAPQKLVIAGLSGATPEPAQPVSSVQPAPQNTLPQPVVSSRPSYQPPPEYQAPRQSAPSRTPAAQRPANAPHKVPTPQELLKELEAMHGQQNRPQ